MNNIENVAEIFSLTLNQARIMFSIEYALTKHDIENTKNENKKRKKEKKKNGCFCGVTALLTLCKIFKQINIPIVQCLRYTKVCHYMTFHS